MELCDKIGRTGEDSWEKEKGDAFICAGLDGVWL